MEKNASIFIAGHLGMVGSALHRKLTEKGYSRFILRTVKELDLVDQAAVNHFFAKEKPEYVMIAAAKVGGIMANNLYRAQFLYENLMIQNNIIHAAWKNRVKKLLFLGSSCIYPKLAPQPLLEEYLLSGELEPTNEPYAVAKIAGIKMCESYFRQYGCNFLSVMPTNLYGPNDNYSLETSHVLPALIRKIYLAKCLEQENWEGIQEDLRKRPVEGAGPKTGKKEMVSLLGHYGIEATGPRSSRIILWGSGTPLREFLHVNDMADACIFVMENIDNPLPYASPFFNIGSGNEISIRDLAEMTRQIIGFTGEIRWDLSKPDGTPRKLLDVSRLKKLGWEYKISLQQGIQMVFNQYTA